MLIYKTKRVRSIIMRETGKCFDYDDFNTEIQFGEDTFTLCMFPELKEELEVLQKLYDSYSAHSDVFEENFYTSNIEGANIATIDETREICNAKINHGKKEGMVLGYSKAVDILLKNPQLKPCVELADLIQAELTSYYNENHKSGYRDNSVYVGTEASITFKPCDCSLIPILYPKVFEAYTDNEFLNATILHFLLVYLHPYFDGNGRTARLMLKEYLVSKGYSKFMDISISKYIHQNLSGYYKSLRLSEEDMDITHFVIYVLEIMEDALLDK